MKEPRLIARGRLSRNTAATPRRGRRVGRRAARESSGARLRARAWLATSGYAGDERPRPYTASRGGTGGRRARRARGLVLDAESEHVALRPRGGHESAERRGAVFEQPGVGNFRTSISEFQAVISKVGSPRVATREHGVLSAKDRPRTAWIFQDLPERLATFGAAVLDADMSKFSRLEAEIAALDASDRHQLSALLPLEIAGAANALPTSSDPAASASVGVSAVIG